MGENGQLESILSFNNRSLALNRLRQNGFVYETKVTNAGGIPEPNDHTDLLQFIPQEEGRIRFKPATTNASASFEYDYMLKDHLGNVRMVLTEEQQTNMYPAATMETANSETENLFYGNIDATRIGKPSWFSDPLYNNSQQVAHVRDAPLAQKIGPNIILKVMAGDSYNVRVASGWQGSNPTQPPVSDILADLLGSLTNGVANNSGGKVTAAELQNPASGLNSALGNFLSTQPAASGKPKAYVNWILLDEQFKIDITGSGFEQVGASGVTTIHTANNLPVNKNGYLYIYVSNESDNTEVFFDNLQVTHVRGPILEETHYYPFGLTMAGISSKAAGSLENKKKWNAGSELNTDFDINLYETQYRNLDPQLGRFWQIDPKPDYAQSLYSSMKNNPISFSDPLGDTVITNDQARTLQDLKSNYKKDFFKFNKNGELEFTKSGSRALARNKNYAGADVKRVALAASLNGMDRAINGTQKTGIMYSNDIIPGTVRDGITTRINVRPSDFGGEVTTTSTDIATSGTGLQLDLNGVPVDNLIRLNPAETTTKMYNASQVIDATNDQVITSMRNGTGNIPVVRNRYNLLMHGIGHTLFQGETEQAKVLDYDNSNRILSGDRKNLDYEKTHQ